MFELIFILFPFCIALLLAVVVYEFIQKTINKQCREERRKAHKAQAEADMAEMSKLYLDNLIHQILKEKDNVSNFHS